MFQAHLLAGLPELSELAALRRCDIDLDARTVSITRQLTEVSGHLAFGPPKSDAGRRIIVVPALIIPDLRWHLSCFAQPGDDGLVFTSPTGMPLRHGHFRSRVWVKAVSQAGLSALHFHDLRHAGNMLTAATGATLRELMDRMGYATARAALIYQHGSHARRHEIADALGQLARQKMTDPSRANKGKRGKAMGTGRAHRGPEAS